MPLNTDRLASVITKAEIPVPAMKAPLTAPAIAPMARAAMAANGTGRPQTCIRPAKLMAGSPPIAPTARFIWPIAMMIICEKAIRVLMATASSSTSTLSRERNEGARVPMTTTASTVTARGPNQSV